MKLRGFKRTYIGRVRLIQQHGEFAEDGTRLRHPNTASTAGSPPATRAGRGPGGHRALLCCQPGHDLAPAGVMRLSIILIYRKPLCLLAYRLKLRNERIVRLDRGLNR